MGLKLTPNMATTSWGSKSARILRDLGSWRSSMSMHPASPPKSSRHVPDDPLVAANSY